MKDPYKILNVVEDAEQEVIAAAYKALARKYHPDVSELDADRMKEINWAYDLLRDKKRRAKWDSQRKTTRNKAEPRPASPHQPKPDVPRSANLQSLSIGRIMAAVIGFIMFFFLASLIGNNQSGQSQPLSTNTRIIVTSSSKKSTLSPLKAALETRIAQLQEKGYYGPGSPPEGLFLVDNQCKNFSVINTSDLGKSICVYGTINLAWWNSGLYTVNFTANQSLNDADFRFTSTETVNEWFYLNEYEELANQAVSWNDLNDPKHCVAAIGEITYIMEYPFLTIDLANEETALYWLSPNPCDY